MSDDKGHEGRIISLEESLMHLERMAETLNEVVCRIQERLDDQDRTLATLSETMTGLAEGEAQPRSLEDEKPPHY